MFRTSSSLFVVFAAVLLTFITLHQAIVRPAYASVTFGTLELA